MVAPGAFGPFAPNAAALRATVESVVAAGVTVTLQFRRSGRILVAEVVSDPDARGRFRIQPWGCAVELARLADVARANVVEGYGRHDRVEAIRRQRARGRLDTGEPWPRPEREGEASSWFAADGFSERLRAAAERLGVPSARRPPRGSQGKVDE